MEQVSYTAIFAEISEQKEAAKKEHEACTQQAGAEQGTNERP